jgi:hypothetical protein
VFTGEEWHAHQPMNLEPGTGPSPEPAVTVVSRDPAHLDLFWVDPFDGRIMSCFFEPLPSGASAWNGANAQSRSFGLTAARAAPLDASVAVVSTDAQSIDVFWISAGGHVKQLRWRGTRVTDPSGSPQVFEVAADGSAWPDGELAANAFGAAGQRRIALVWGQADGSVQSRMSDGGRWIENQIGPPAPGGAPHPDEANPPQTIVSIVSRSAAKLDVFWVDPRNGSVMTRWFTDGAWNCHTGEVIWSACHSDADSIRSGRGAGTCPHRDVLMGRCEWTPTRAAR